MRAFCVPLLVSFSVFGYAQDKYDPLVRGGVNIQYLEHLVKEKVDSVRAEHNLQALKNDSILYVAAKDHADYMNARDELTHFESDIPDRKSVV